MYRHRLVEISEIHVRERTNLDHARVIDEDVYSTRALHYLADHALGIGGLAHITDKARDVPAGWLEYLPRTVELISVAGHEGNARSFRRQLPGDDEAEPAGATGDEHRSSAEIERPPPPAMTQGECAQAEAKGSGHHSQLLRVVPPVGSHLTIVSKRRTWRAPIFILTAGLEVATVG
jgi:hypothetical protein